MSNSSSPPTPDALPEDPGRTQKDGAGLTPLLREVRDCKRCAAELPLGPRPVVLMAASARLLIVGQAPGTRVHKTGLPWNDASGDRLRDWLRIEPARFYDPDLVAIMPMGFCYPGRDARGGDKPPKPICAPTWHPRLLAELPGIELTLLIGLYAQARYLESRRKANLTETVKAWREYLPDVFALPHPSWRNTAWLKRNPWFEAELLPELRARVRAILD